MIRSASRRAVAIVLIIAGLAALSPQGPSIYAAAGRDAFNSTVFRDYEEYEGTVYMGLSGPYTDKAKALRVALENACTMASVAQELRMRADLDIHTDTRRDIDRMRVYSSGDYSPEIYSDVMKNMEIVDLVWYGDDIGAAAFISYGDASRIEWDHDVDWEKQPIKVPGYVFAVGTVKEYYYIQDSINAAAYEGAVNLVLNHQDSIVAVNEEISMDEENMEVYAYQIGFNILEGFTVLAYSYDPAARTYSALVGAKL